MSESSSGSAANAGLCNAIRDEYGLTMTVVMDPTGATEAYGSNDLFMVTDAEAVITFKRRFASELAVQDAIERELAR